MNNKEFINKMAERLDMPAKEVQKLVAALTDEIANQMEDGSVLAIQGFGNFEVRKKLERVLINPTTKQRMLVPPKLVLSFKPGNTLKDRVKQEAGKTTADQ